MDARTDPALNAGGTFIAAALLGFARTLRAAGVNADPPRVQAFFAALDTVGVASAREVYWAGRLTLCSGPEELRRYDACFAHYFSAQPPPGPGGASVTVVRPAVWYADRGEESGSEAGETQELGAAGDIEVLRSADIARLTAAERAEVARLLERLAARRETRRTRRAAPARRGRMDHARTLRATSRHGGEPMRLFWRRPARRPRRVVLLVDVSGSMSPYADALLRLAHAMVRGHPDHTEVFSVGTRLTRLTRELRGREAASALTAAGKAIPDWNGGTRLGVELKEFLDAHGRRGMARGAMVIIASDGWERGGAALLGEQMARLSRLAHRVVWANPHKAQPGYEPLAGGMHAALPHVDDFVAGHSLGALEELATVVADPSAARRSRRNRRA